MTQELNSKTSIILKKSEELSQLKKKMLRAGKEAEILQSQKSEVERQRDFFKNEISNFSKIINAQVNISYCGIRVEGLGFDTVLPQRRLADTDDKAISEIEGQLKRLAAGFNLSKEKNRVHLELARAHKEAKQSLEDDIKNHKITEEKLLKVLLL